MLLRTCGPVGKKSKMTDIPTKIDRFNQAARRERLSSPEMVQKTKAVRYPQVEGEIGSKYAWIVKTLQRADPVNEIEARNYYEIELVSAAIPEWRVGEDYTKGYSVKLVEGARTYYECREDHTSTEARRPDIAPAYWDLKDSPEKAWVHGYYDDLLEASPWFKEGDMVEVLKRKEFDSNGEPTGESKWWIIETVRRVETTVGGYKRYSIFFDPAQWREKAVFA